MERSALVERIISNLFIKKRKKFLKKFWTGAKLSLRERMTAKWIIIIVQQLVFLFRRFAVIKFHFFIFQFSTDIWCFWIFILWKFSVKKFSLSKAGGAKDVFVFDTFSKCLETRIKKREKLRNLNLRFKIGDAILCCF